MYLPWINKYCFHVWTVCMVIIFGNLAKAPNTSNITSGTYTKHQNLCAVYINQIVKKLITIHPGFSCWGRAAVSVTWPGSWSRRAVTFPPRDSSGGGRREGGWSENYCCWCPWWRWPPRRPDPAPPQQAWWPYRSHPYPVLSQSPVMWTDEAYHQVKQYHSRITSYYCYQYVKIS